MQNVEKESKNKAKQSRREELLSRLPVPGPGRKKLTEEQKERNKIIRKTKEDIIKYLEGQGYGAAQRIIKISKQAPPKTALSANQDILDRIGVTKEKKGIGVAIQVNVDQSREQYA